MAVLVQVISWIAFFAACGLGVVGAFVVADYFIMADRDYRVFLVGGVMGCAAAIIALLSIACFMLVMIYNAVRSNQR